MEFEHYKKHNSLTRIIQKIGIREFNELAKKLDMRSLKDGDAISSDVVVNTLLSKTLREQRRYLDGLRK
jgi:tRNA 2-selenouridine synthase SelU